MLPNAKLYEIAKKTSRELRKNQTKAESVFWETVRNRKFDNLKFNRQYPLFFDYLGKETFYVADFYCHEKRLVVEIDGSSHDNKLEKDLLRTEIINLLGITVVRFKNDEVVNNINVVLQKLRDLPLTPCPSPKGRGD